MAVLQIRSVLLVFLLFSFSSCLAGAVDGGDDHDHDEVPHDEVPVLQLEDDAPLAINVGDNITITWKQNKMLDEYANGELGYRRPGGLVDRLAAIQGSSADVENSDYTLVVTPGDDGTSREFTMTLAAAGEDVVGGSFQLALFYPEGGEENPTLTVGKGVDLKRELADVVLQFGDDDPIKASLDSPVGVQPGTFTVRCTAEGSNPKVGEISIQLDENKVELTGDRNDTHMDGDEMRFKSSIHADITIPDKPSATHALKCMATGPMGTVKTVMMNLKVMGPEVSPVQCQKAKAKEGDKIVSLMCIVDDSKLNVTEYAFEIGKTGEKIVSGATDGNETKTGGEVTVTKLEAGKTQVRLILDEAKDLHFETDFYLLLTTKDGDVKKETLRLEKSDGGDSDSAQALSFGLGFSGILLLSLLVNADWL